MVFTTTGRIYRVSVQASAAFLCAWAMLLTVEYLYQRGENASWFGTLWLGSHIPLYYLRFAEIPFLLWLIADLFFIRKAPPEFRKAQWATTVLMLLLFTITAAVLGSFTSALDWVARQA